MPRYVFATLAESPQTTLSSMVTLPSVGLSDDEEMAAVIVDPFSSSPRSEPEIISSDHTMRMFVDPRISMLCRSCGKEKADMINIFSGENEAMFLPEKIQDVLSIPVSRMDERPQQMCEACIAQLELAHEFRVKYLKAEDHFCNLLKSPEVDEMETNLDSLLSELDTEEQGGENPGETTIIISVVKEPATPPSTPTSPVTVNSVTPTPVTPVTPTSVISTPVARTTKTTVAKAAPKSTVSKALDLEILELVEKYKKYEANCPKELHCLLCNKKFTDLSSLITHHMKRHTRSQLFLCVKCFKDFKLKEEFEVHVVETHSHSKEELAEVWNLPTDSKPRKQRPMCMKCNISFNTRAQYTNHYLNCHKNHFKCSDCGKEFSKNEDWKNHRRRHNPRHKSKKGIKSCPYCEFTAKFKSLVNEHMNREHRELLPKFHCDHCGKIYANKILLKYHINQTHNTVGRSHLCDQCGESFKHKITLTQHKYRHLSELGKRRMECAVCSKHVTVATFIHHMSRHITKTPYSCPICKIGIALKANLERHLKAHEKGNELQCLLCETVMMNKQELSEHKVKHLNAQKTFSCPICNEVFKSYQGIVAHCKSLHKREQLREYYKQNSDILKIEHKIVEEITIVDDTILKCNFCEHKAKDVADYFSHRQTHEESFTLKCEFCDQRFVTMRSRNAHVLGHSNIKPFPCDQCSLSFACKDYLRTHQTQKHNEKNILNCPQCEKIFHSQKYLQRHINTHEKQNNRPVYICIHCDKKFKNKIVFEKHMETYIRKENPILYDCNICNKQFKFKMMFEKHIKMHAIKEQSPIFECNHCSKKFKTKLKCEQHMKTHKDMNVYECTLCFKEFKGTVRFNKHLKTHTRVEVNSEQTTVFVLCPHQCKGCGKAFTSKKHKLNHESMCDVKIEQVVEEEPEVDDTVRIIVDTMYD